MFEIMELNVGYYSGSNLTESCGSQGGAVISTTDRSGFHSCTSVFGNKTFGTGYLHFY